MPEADEADRVRVDVPQEGVNLPVGEKGLGRDVVAGDTERVSHIDAINHSESIYLAAWYS